MKKIIFLFLLFLLVDLSGIACEINTCEANYLDSTQSNAAAHAPRRKPTGFSYPRGYFASPVDVPILLAGTFGELRPNHFHGGIDIKTQQREGLNISAVAEGYVSRINVSGSGYGNCLYITHPNGYTSVYGHLKSFNAAITAYLRTQQYAEQRSIIDLKIQPGVLNVSKKEIVALSGNTGGSQGPHLHFEIRDTGNEETINPLLFGFSVEDNIKPNVGGLMMYTFDDNNKQTSRKSVVLSKKNGIYYAATQTVNSPNVSFSLNTQDAMNNSDGNNGIFSISTKLNGSPYFRYVMERFSFANSRAIHAHIDYEFLENKGGRYHRAHTLVNDKLECYREQINNGIFQLSDTATQTVTIAIDDANYNTVYITIPLRYNSTLTPVAAYTPAHRQILYCLQDNTFNQNGLQCVFPEGVFYEDVYFNHTSAPSVSPTIFSNIHQVHNDNIPIHTFYEMKIEARNLTFDKAGKALIIYEDESGKKINRGGVWDGQYVSGKAREFGKFYVTLDETPPTISLSNKPTVVGGVISFRIADNLSGIDQFSLYIDNTWQVLQYDAKSSRVWFALNDEIRAGAHTYQLDVNDERGNSNSMQGNFTIY